MLHTKYQGSRHYGFRQEDFSMFPYMSLCKTCDPQGRDNFYPQGDHLNKLGRGPLGDATFQISRLWALWFQTSRLFLCFPYISLCIITCDPWGHAIIGPRGII